MDTFSASASSKQEAQRSARLRNWIVGILAALVLAAVAWFLFVPDPIKVETATVTQGPMQVSIDNQGQVRAHDKFIVAAPVAAELERIDLHEGDPVRRNQVVAVLSPLPMDARQKQEARARLDSAKALARKSVV